MSNNVCLTRIIYRLLIISYTLYISRFTKFKTLNIKLLSKLNTYFNFESKQHDPVRLVYFTN